MKPRAAAALLLLIACAARAQPLGVLSENPRYYSYRGKPLLIVTSAEHYGAVLNLDFDYERYLQALEAAGMNYTRIFSGGPYVESQGSFNIRRNTLAPAPARYLAPWMKTAGGKYDLSRFNPDYFARLRSFMTAAARRGVIVEMTFFSSIYGDAQWKINPLHPDNNVNRTRLLERLRVHTLDNDGLLEFQLALVRRIVAELNEFDNLLYEVQNEPWVDQRRLNGVVHPYFKAEIRDVWPNSIDAPTTASLEWQARIIEEIRQAEAKLPSRHLTALNWSNFRDPIQELPPGAGAVHFHYAYPEAVLWNTHLNLPVGCDETGFMGAEDEPYRRQAWEFMLSGGALYNHLDYSFTVGHEDGSEPEQAAPGGGSAALRLQLAALRRFMEATPFWRMAPDLAFIQEAPGRATRAFTLPGTAYLAYAWGAGQRPLTVRLPPGRWTVDWMDAASTQVVTSDLVTHGAPVRLQPPAGSRDVALRIQRAQKP